MISSSDILHAKILIVDDQQANIVLLERMLRGVGCDSITSMMDANEVCELHRKNRYDLILLDLEMPGMGFSGFQVMEALKEIEPDGYLPVIVISAHPDHKLHALQAGAMDFISKPFELAEVLARVHNMLEVRMLYVEMKSYIKSLEQRVKEMEASRARNHGLSDADKNLHDKSLSTTEGDASTLAQATKPRGVRLRTLLHIEDKPDSLKLVTQIVARIPDIRLLTAMNGKIGIEMARASLPDVILMDINLPDLNGFKVLEILRKDTTTAHIPVIAISANALPLNIESGLEAGFFRYLTKPIKVSEFMEALNVALEFSQNAANKVK